MNIRIVRPGSNTLDVTQLEDYKLYFYGTDESRIYLKIHNPPGLITFINEGMSSGINFFSEEEVTSGMRRNVFRECPSDFLITIDNKP